MLFNGQKLDSPSGKRDYAFLVKVDRSILLAIKYLVQKFLTLKNVYSFTENSCCDIPSCGN